MFSNNICTFFGIPSGSYPSPFIGSFTQLL